MHLVVHIPYCHDEDSVRALSLARQAPSFTMEWINQRKVAVAIYAALPAGIEGGIRLVGEAIRLSDAWASMDAKPVLSLAKLWQRLVCYRESLYAEDPKQYCRERSALFNHLVRCEEHHCPVPCQFVCTPCMKMEQVGTAVTPTDRYRAAAELAEIEWCPRLQLPSDNPSVIIQPCFVKSSTESWSQ